MFHHLIFLPLLAMVALTMVVWVRLYAQRMGEINRRRIQPQDVATRRLAANVLEETSAADNFANLFEVPVLFYVLCLVAYGTGGVTTVLLWGAWLFVALRAAHSFIHCTYNAVLHRFAVYLLSTLVLFACWGVLAMHLLGMPR